MMDRTPEREMRLILLLDPVWIAGPVTIEMRWAFVE